MTRRELLKWIGIGMGSGVLPSAIASVPLGNGHPVRVPWQSGDELLELSVSRGTAPGPVVVYVHGATFPSALSVGWKMQGVSWMDFLQDAGFDAWTFDFAGYGRSSRPAAFGMPANASPPFGDHIAAAAQIVAVLEHIRRQRADVPIHVIAHSWGTLAAQRVAVERSDLVQRLVLFGPLVTRTGRPNVVTHPAWELITSDMQRPRQRTGMPASLRTPVSAEELERWCAAYLSTDPSAASRSPASVKVPNGPAADIARMWAGERLVDSGKVRQPTLIVRGEWDHITTDQDAQRLFEELGSMDKRDIKISGGNHWLHLQPRRSALWSEVASFLKEEA